MITAGSGEVSLTSEENFEQKEGRKEEGKEGRRKERDAGRETDGWTPHFKVENGKQGVAGRGPLNCSRSSR